MKYCYGKPSRTADAESLVMILGMGFCFHFPLSLLSHVDLRYLEISLYYNKILTLQQIFSSNNFKLK